MTWKFLFCANAVSISSKYVIHVIFQRLPRDTMGVSMFRKTSQVTSPAFPKKNTLFELEIIHNSPIMGSSYSFTKIKSGICFRLNGHRKS